MLRSPGRGDACSVCVVPVGNKVEAAAVHWRQEGNRVGERLHWFGIVTEMAPS
jgi:hypothetical protein